MVPLHWKRACLCALVAASSCARTKHDIQSDYARERLSPASIEAQKAPGPKDSVVVATILAYADAEFRQDPRWKRRLASLMERANAFLEPEFGLRLEVRGVLPWDRSASIEDMQAALDELERLDAGQRSDFVVGISGSAPLVTATFDHLGMAKILRPVFLLRALDHAQEATDFAQSLSALSSLELDRLARDRVQHKELVVFLHELGHAVGIPHLHTSGSFMNPVYDRTLSSYGALGTRLVRQALPLALERRRASPERRAALEASLLRVVEGSPSAEWAGSGREDLLAILRGSQRESSDGAHVMPPEEARSFNAALELANAGKHRQAWELLDSKLVSESHPALWLLACQIGSMPGARVGEKAWVACRRAASRDPADALPLLLLSDMLFTAGDRAGALEAAEQAERRLERQPSARQVQWAQLSGRFERLDALSASERCAERAAPPQRQALLEWSRGLRRRACLAALASDPPLSAAQESEVVEALRRGWEMLEGGRLEEARALADSAGRLAPAAAGPRALLCEVDWRSGRRAKARGECQAALAAQDDCLPALQIAGVMAIQEGSLDRAERLLKKALVLAPEEPSTLNNLAVVLRAQGRSRELVEIEASRQRQLERAQE
jgi:tetratricopeptide (TPR) repeat protein